MMHLTPSFGCGGLEKVIVNVTAFSQNQNIEHHVVSLTADLSFSHALPANVKVYSLHKLEGKDFACHWRLFKLLMKIRPNVLHSYNFGTLEYHAIAMLAGVRRRIHADHGMGGDTDSGKNSIKNRFRKIMSPLLHHYVVVSENLKEWLITQVGVSPEKVKLLRNGVPVPAVFNDKLLGTRNLIHVGRLSEVKNQKRLLCAFSEYCQKRPGNDSTLTLVGEGPMRESLEKLTRTLPESTQKKIIFAGFQDDTGSFYEKADAFVLSSDYEAMPMTALEAMSQGVFVMLPKVGGIPDSIPEKTALLYAGHDTEALTNALLKWHDMTSAQRTAIAIRGFNLAKGFSVDNMVREYEALYLS